MEHTKAKAKFKKSAHALAILPSRQAIVLSVFDRKLINIVLKTSIEAGAAEHEVTGYKGRFFGLSQTDIGANMRLPKMFDYQHLRDSMEKLQHITLKMESPSDSDNDMEGAPSKKLLGSLVLLPTVVHEKRDERVLEGGNLMSFWQFNENLEKFLLDPKRYATLRIDSITSLSRASSIALYEICARFASSPTHSTGFKDLNWWIEALTGYVATDVKRPVTYSNYKYFSRDVLTPSIKEVNEKTELEVSIDLEKEGKKVSRIRFFVNPKSIDSSKISANKDNDSSLEDLRFRALALGITDIYFSKLCKKHRPDIIQLAIEGMEKTFANRAGDKEAEPIRSSNAYINSVINNILDEQNSGQKSILEAAPVEPRPRPPRMDLLTVEAAASAQSAEMLARFEALSSEKQADLIEKAITAMEEKASSGQLAAFMSAKPIKNLKNRNLVGHALEAVFDQLNKTEEAQS